MVGGGCVARVCETGRGAAVGRTHTGVSSSSLWAGEVPSGLSASCCWGHRGGGASRRAQGQRAGPPPPPQFSPLGGLHSFLPVNTPVEEEDRCRCWRPGWWEGALLASPTSGLAAGPGGLCPPLPQGPRLAWGWPPIHNITGPGLDTPSYVPPRREGGAGGARHLANVPGRRRRGLPPSPAITPAAAREACPLRLMLARCHTPAFTPPRSNRIGSSLPTTGKRTHVWRGRNWARSSQTAGAPRPTVPSARYCSRRHEKRGF